MKKIFQLLHQHWVNDIKPAYVAACLAFCLAMVYFQYSLHFPFNFFHAHHQQPTEFLGYLLLFGCAFFFPIFIGYFFIKDTLKQIPWQGWLMCIAVVVMFSFRSYLYQYRSIANLFHLQNDSFFRAIADNIFQGLALLLPIGIIYMFTQPDRAFYGLLKMPREIGGYLWMLVIMLPLIYMASTQKDFQAQYPKYIHEAGLDKNNFTQMLAFEGCYIFDFIMIELFFRGFVLQALQPYLGKFILLPMVCLYVSIHLWKPAGETVSSFFGGYILGVLALETRSIWGGIVAHCGVALIMEWMGRMWV